MKTELSNWIAACALAVILLCIWTATSRTDAAADERQAADIRAQQVGR